MQKWTEMLTCVTQSAAAISIVIMAAALFPDAEKWVQDQIDTVVGKDRCEHRVRKLFASLPDLISVPSFDDMETLTRVDTCQAYHLQICRLMCFPGNCILSGDLPMETR